MKMERALFMSLAVRRISFVHIRDVIGTPSKFRETFQDNGPTDMHKMMKYTSRGLTRPLHPDHVPTMAEQTNGSHGYEMKGSLFGIGYIKGLQMQQVQKIMYH
jgi:mannonate dehydratase